MTMPKPRKDNSVMKRKSSSSLLLLVHSPNSRFRLPLWLCRPLSRLGIAQASLASSCSVTTRDNANKLTSSSSFAPRQYSNKLDIALGLASVWPLRSLNETFKLWSSHFGEQEHRASSIIIRTFEAKPPYFVPKEVRCFTASGLPPRSSLQKSYGKYPTFPTPYPSP